MGESYELYIVLVFLLRDLFIKKKTNKNTQNNGQGVQTQGGTGGVTQQTNGKQGRNGQNGGNAGRQGGSGQNKPLPQGQANGEPDIPIP